jgi:hypothetical protein
MATSAYGRYDQSLLEQSVFVNILGVALLELFFGNVRSPLHGLSLRVALGAHL